MSIRLTAVSIMAGLCICAAPAAALAGDEESPVAANWGNAYEANKKAQIEHPDAGRCTRPVTGLDGKAAEKAVDGYHESFGKGAAPQNYNINLGEISGVGQK